MLHIINEKLRVCHAILVVSTLFKSVVKEKLNLSKKREFKTKKLTFFS